MKIVKRDGTIRDFDAEKIYRAVIQAMNDADEVSEDIANDITNDIEAILDDADYLITVDEIQDLVEELLMENGLKKTAKAYIIYRHNKDKYRHTDEEYKMLSKEFLSKYKHIPNPFPTDLGHFVYLRTYSRWIPAKNRRENWWETVARIVDYNCTLVPTTKEEAEKLYDNIFNLRQFLSGRTTWVGGTKVAESYPSSNFNCCFKIIDDLDAFADLFYLLMLGAGVGVRVLKSDVEKIGKIRGDMNLVHEYYNPKPKSERDDNTSLVMLDKLTAKIVVGDSKGGWVKSLEFFLSLISDNDYENIKNIIINYDNVRPKGEPLKTFGGTASGHESVQNMFTKINKVIKKRASIDGNIFKLKPIDCLDIANIIGENVVVGGVRRCLPKGSLVHTEGGLVPIEDVKIGTKVKTSKGYSKVVDWVEQGKQKLLTIHTQQGEFRCTPKHKMAILTSPNEYKWVQARELKAGDRLVFVDTVTDGKDTELPYYDVQTENSKDITLPKLDSKMAWFFGYFHGNGYVGNSEISVAVPYGLEKYSEDVADVIQSFGVNATIHSPDDEKCYKIRCKSKQLSSYLKNFKMPNKSIVIPKFIKEGKPEIRAKYLMGLYDADGTAKNRPVVAVCSIYKPYLEEVQSLYASLGISTRLTLSRPAQGNWKDLYVLNIIGENEKIKFENIIVKDSLKYDDACKTKRSQNDYGYPSDWFEKGYKNWCINSKQMTVSRYEKIFNDRKNLVPVEVFNLSYDDEELYETYDISVEEHHEFVCGSGLLVHNTSEILLIDADDKECIEAKSNLYKQIDGQWIVDKDIIHRQMSNNSIYYKEKPSREMLHWQIQQMRYSGEPAWVNAEAGSKRRENMNGVNPCLTGDMKILTKDGYVEIGSLEGQEVEIVNVNGQISKGKVWYSGEKPTVRITLPEGKDIRCTQDHVFMLNDGTECDAFDLKGKRLMPFLHHKSIEELNLSPEMQIKLQSARQVFDMYGITFNNSYVVVKSKDEMMLREVYMTLDELGINSHIVHEYKHLELRVSRFNNLIKFYEMVGFRNPKLMEILKQNIIDRSPVIKKVENTNFVEKVYDFSEPITNWGVVEGYVVHNCGEILLDDRGMCNLTTVNVMAFVKDGELDLESLLGAQKLSARAGYRMTCVTLEKHKWDNVQQRDKLLGCSLTGWQDMVNATKMNIEQQAYVLRQLRDIATSSSSVYAKQIGGNVPLLVTTLKPEGTMSQLPTVSSGIHYSHSPYFLRRVRINAHDPLVKVCEELEYPIFPEVGQSEENCSTKVIEFPIRAPEGRTKYDVSAIEQLENYKLFMKNYVQHNASITVHVREHEWEEVEQWVWDNWDDVVAVSFISLDDSFYKLMPYESILKEELESRLSKMKPFNPSLLQKYEQRETELDIGDDGCESGICPIR